MDAAEYVSAQHECRAKLTRRLGWEKVPDAVWGHVDHLGLVYGAITGGDRDSWQQLEDEARNRREILDRETPGSVVSRRGKGRGAPREIEVKLDQYARCRGEAFSEVVAALADRHPGVRRFRETFLEDRFLSEAEADLFVRTQKRALFFGSQQDALRLQDHGAATLRIHGQTLDRTTQAHAVEDLWKLAQMLAKTYYWEELDALWFILTGQAPHLSPLRVTATQSGWKERYLPMTARITVEADVWVEAKSVRRAFQDAQRHVLGGDTRPLSDRTVEVVKFVARRMRRYGEESWSERLRVWNSTCPEGWRYESYRSLRRVFERFIHPSYNPPSATSYESSVETPYEQWQHGQY